VLATAKLGGFSHPSMPTGSAKTISIQQNTELCRFFRNLIRAITEACLAYY